MKGRPIHHRMARAFYAVAPRPVRAAMREILGPWPLQDFPVTDKGADLSRLVLDWVASTQSPDWELQGVIRRLRARARDLERNNAYVASYLNLLDVNVIGPSGFGHDASVRTSAGELNNPVNEKIETAFARWCEHASLDGRLSLVELESLGLKTVARDGEIFFREWTSPDLPFGYALEPVDCDLVPETLNRAAGSDGSPAVRMGVEIGPFGRPSGYHVETGYADAHGIGTYSNLGVGGNKTVVIPAAEMIHLARYRRVNQTRGVTWLGPTMISLRMLDGYEEAELVAARTAAAKMGFFQAKAGEAGTFGPDDPSEPMTMDAAPGVLEQLPRGYEFAPWDPQHPTSQFPSFVKNILRKVAAGLGCSYNALASDLEGVNYSSMRSGLLIERDVWRRLQQWWLCAFRTRVYRSWLRAAINSGELRVGLYDFDALAAVRWQPRGWSWVDPLKDGQAGVLDVQTGFASRQMLCAEQGIDFEQVLDDLVEEEKMAKAHGLDISGPRQSPQSAGSGDAGEPADTSGDTGAEQAGTAPARAQVLEALRNGGSKNGKH